MGDLGERGEITQQCAIFRNRRIAKRRRGAKKIGREPGTNGTGRGRFKARCPQPPIQRVEYDFVYDVYHEWPNDFNIVVHT